MPAVDGPTTPTTLDDQAAAPPQLPAEFLYGATSLARCPRDALPEVAFAGRSNAGKSSTLNRLTGRNALARTSKTPGRTQLINLFATAGGGRLVDLPGFGYARAPKAQREAWERAVRQYLSRRENLAAVVLVMDCRHPLQAADQAVVEDASQRGLPLLALLNKADKLSRSRQAAVLRAAATALPATAEPLLFSATTGIGVAAARRFVAKHLAIADATALPGVPRNPQAQQHRQPRAPHVWGVEHEGHEDGKAKNA